MRKNLILLALLIGLGALAQSPNDYVVMRAWRQVRSAAVAGPWTPADLGNLEAWYDFADPTMSQLSGNAITNMFDKSGNGWELRESSAGTNVLLTANALNGKSVMDNTGTARFLQTRDALGSFSITGGVNRTIITLAKRPDASARYITAWGATAATGNFCGLTSEYYLRFATAVKGYTNKGANDTWTLAAAVGSGNTLNNYDVFFDGEINASTPNASNSTTSTLDTKAGPLTIGGTTAGSAPLAGQIAEVLILDAAISTADRQRSEGYLSHKWGTTANLPSDHPYKSAPPTK